MVREIAEAVVTSAKDFADAATDKDAWNTAREGVRVAAERASSSARTAVERASSSARDLGAQAQRIIELLQSAPEDATDASRLLERFVEVLPSIRAQLDREAQAISIGYLGEGGVGIQRLSGVEIMYVRGSTPRLRVSRLDGRGARMAAGVATSAYAGCLYGNSVLLNRPLVRRGADVGAAVAAFRFFRGSATGVEGTAGGWLVALNAGLGFGIPILSDLGAFEVSETFLGDFLLEPEQAEQIEAALEGAPDRSWRRGLAQSLAG